MTLYISNSAQEIGNIQDFKGMNQPPFNDETITVINSRGDVYTTGTIHMGWNSPTYSWSLTSDYLEEGTHISIEQSGEYLDVSFIDETGLYPLNYLIYIDTDFNPVEVYSFSDLPSEALHISLMKADDKDYVEGVLDVSVTALDSEGKPVSDSATYYIYIFANHNVLRDKLRDETDKRRIN